MLNMHPEKLEGLIFSKFYAIILKVLCPLESLLLTRGFLLKTFEIYDQVEWELESHLHRESFWKNWIDLWRRSKQNCLKNCRKLRNDYYVIIVGEAFCWKSSLRCGFRDTYWKIILQENISKCHLLQWSKDFGWF